MMTNTSRPAGAARFPALDLLRVAPGTTAARHGKGAIADIPVLHGWRAASILLVIACHWFPPSPHALRLNEAAGTAGMALFFTLSGFLITGFLVNGEELSIFAIKRVARIVPLAWLAVALLALWNAYPAVTVARNFGFIANLPEAALMTGGHHLWSLCVEVQFYLLVAALCKVLGRMTGLLMLPILCLAVTVARGLSHEFVSIVTWHRIYEIFAGCTLALVYFGRLGRKSWIGWLPTYPIGIVFLISCLAQVGPLQLARPYLAAALVGSTLCGAPQMVETVLTSRFMLRVARLSYALYVIHGMLTDTWIGSEPGKYLKRPLLIVATAALAELSTRYLEEPINRMARIWSKRLCATATGC